MPAFGLRAAAGQVTLIRREVSIGRDAVCQLRVPADPLVSRVHTTVWASLGTLHLRDEHSSNGTFVNEAPVAPGQPVPLAAGDQIRVGASVWVVVLVPVAAAARDKPNAPARPDAASTTATILVPKPASPKAAPKSLPAWVVIGGAAAGALAAIAAVILALASR
jgi:predicted component of type VI protein secretion system